MDTAGIRRALVVAVVVTVLASTLAASATAGRTGTASAPESNGFAAPEPAPAAAGGFAADATGPTAPTERVTTAVTESGGTASAVGTDAVFESPPTNVTSTQELRLTPDAPGEITVVQRYRVPDRLSSLQPTLPEGVSVTGTEGFSEGDGRTYEWDGDTANPRITFTMRPNETRELAGPEGARGRYLFVDAGDWGLVRRPAVSTSWSWRGGAPVGITRNATTAGPGHVGEWMAYMGEYETHERAAHGQRFRLVVPTRASLAESPSAVLDSLSAASDQLRVGDRDRTVTAFAAPTTTVGWGVRGLQYGDSDMWVRDAEPLDTAENTWLHEYVHTRQDYETTSTTRWTNEAFATYYAALLALEQDHTDYREFRGLLREGTVRPQTAATLSQPGTWANAANYLKGSLVAGDTDRRIRLATDQTRSLQSVFAALNAHQGPVDERAVFEAVGNVGGAQVRRAAVTYATTQRSPDTWSRTDHAEAFGAVPARVSVGVATGSDALAVSGPYRNETLSGTDLTLYAGETLTVTAAVTNAGGAAGEYEARLVVDERVVASGSGSIQPGERITYPFERTFAESGEHVVSVGGDELTVKVHDPATATVTDLRANRTELSAPGAVEFTATLSNEYQVPARGNLTLRGPEGVIVDREVPLGPGESRSVSGTARLDRGEYDFTVGDADTLTVTVGDVGDDGSDGDGSDGTEDDGGSFGLGPGFGAAPALVAVLLGAAILVRRENGRR